jgi:hypothetical protein
VSLSEDLDRLDVSLRQLLVKWDMFFSGAEKKPPSELQAQIELIIRRYGSVEIRNNAERFRYQGLTARFNTFNELWQKRLRAREEGKAFGQHGLRAEQMAPPPRVPAVSGPASPAQPAEFRIGGGGAQDAPAIRALYENFVSERHRAGIGAPPPFESFHQLVTQQTQRLRSEKGAAAVDFRLETRDGKVSLKARIVK